MPRNRFALFAALFMALMAASPVSAVPYDYVGFTITQVSPSVYAYISAECTPAGVVSGNVVAIIGDQTVLVVDSGSFPSATRKIIAHLKSVTTKPIQYLVNTHWHQDHIVGNAEFKDVWPGAVILAHSFTANELSKPARGSGFPEAEYENLQKELERLKPVLATGKNADGTALSARDRATLEERREAYLAEFNDRPRIRFVGPEMAISGDLEIYLGKRRVQVKHLGTGNTAGDLVIYVPDEKILVTGDMIVAPTPFALGVDLPAWIETLDKLEAIDAVKIVPGHGPVMSNKEYLRDVRKLFETTLQQVNAAIAAGVPKEKALADLDTTFFKAKYVDSPMREGAYAAFFVNPVVNAAYRRAQPAAK